MNFNEDFVSHLWKFQKFNLNSLTILNEDLKILSPGFLHELSGPDFKDATIKINNIKFSGSIEIHTRSSDWYKHNHHLDKNYNNVILHVVWEQDQYKCLREDGTTLPTLELKNIVDENQITLYKSFFEENIDFPCHKFINNISYIEKVNMLEKAFFKKLDNKNFFINKLLKENNNNWEETIYQSISYNFGMSKNKHNFLTLTKSLLYKIIKKHSSCLIDIEALLYGQASLIPQKKPSEDPYITKIRDIYNFFSHKYKLISLSDEKWNFFGVRPTNFPTIKLAQFAKLLYNNIELSLFTETTDIKLFYKKLKINQSAYWQNHYRFGMRSSKKISGLGKQWINNIIINSIVPISIAYAKYKKKDHHISKIINILHKIPSENNKIINKWLEINVSIKNAFDSQGHISLFNEFCKEKKCLNCSIGNKILDNKKQLKNIYQGSLEKVL